MTGLNGNYGGFSRTFANRLQARCHAATITDTPATPEYTYRFGWTGPETTGTAYGVVTGTSMTPTCNTGDWLVGISGTAACFVDSINIRCASVNFVRSGSSWVPQRGTIYTRSGGGGTSGGAYSYDCPSNMVATQLDITTVRNSSSETFVAGVELGCRSVDDMPL